VVAGGHLLQLADSVPGKADTLAASLRATTAPGTAQAIAGADVVVLAMPRTRRAARWPANRARRCPGSPSSTSGRCAAPGELEAFQLPHMTLQGPLGLDWASAVKLLP
jgi:hypothetical protein